MESELAKTEMEVFLEEGRYFFQRARFYVLIS